MDLSPHFSASELGATDADAQVLASLRALCAHVLEPVRTLLGVPLRVTSGYRTRAHNAAIGGAATSQHCLGLAADVVPVGMSAEVAMQRIASAVRDGKLTLDQAICYAGGGFVHLSWSASPRNMLLQSMAARGSHGPYVKWVATGGAA